LRTWRINLVPAAILLASALLSSCGRPSKIPVRDFFKNPDSSNYRLSPDGNTISYLKPWGAPGRRNIFVRPISGGGERCVTREYDRDIADYFWKGNGHLVYLHPSDNGKPRVRRVDLKTPPEVIDLTPSDRGASLINELEESDDKIVIELSAADRPVSEVIRLSIDGTKEVIEEDHGDVRCWITDGAGQVRGAIALDGLNICLRMRPHDTSPWETLLTTDFRQSIAPELYIYGPEAAYLFPNDGRGNAALMAVASGPGGKEALYAISGIGRETTALVMIDPKTGQEMGQPLYQNPEFDVSGVEFSRKRGATCATFMTWRKERYFLDSETEAIYKTLARNLPQGEDLRITAHDRAEGKFIVELSSDRNPGEYYLFEKKPNKLTKLGEVAPQLRGHLARMKPIKFASRDGRTIHGYLTLPRGRGDKGLPLVVIPHGGPWLRNVWGFNRENREVQFFANRGYAVLQMNFRASVGYGREFWVAGFQQWGRAMQNDVTDGVKWTIDQGVADRKRIAIVGESYGGYAALAGITYTPNLYAAAVARAGISNLLELMESVPPLLQPRLYTQIGDPVRDHDLLVCLSPALHADQINAPLLLAYGTKDQTVNPAQSVEMYDALKRRGADVKCLPVLNEGHVFENEESKIAYYNAVEAFLDKYLH
jgi:dipeptidyl aminopeptidase/acylaminoacyl peptidase